MRTRKSIWFAHLASVVSVAAAIAVAAPSAAANTVTSDTGADGGVGDGVYVSPYTPELQQKLLQTSRLEGSVASQIESGLSQSADLTSPDGTRTSPPSTLCADICPPPGTDSVSTQPNDHQSTTYWCGPASSHNVLGSMNVSVYQSTLADDEGTTTNGTYVGYIPRALNKHQSQDEFVQVNLSSPTDLMTHVEWDVYYRDHSLILYVNPGLGMYNWNGHQTGHYDVAYRYETRDGGYIKVAEEWDPHALGIYPSYGDPYGRWWFTLNNVWKAEGGRGEIIVY